MGKSKILIVDDEPVQLHMMEQVLRARGFEVIKAGNGHEAMRLFLENHPDLVILDVMMPEIDGWQTCRLIRGVSNTPVIMLTGKRTSEDDIVHGLECGADEYLVKPVGSRELLARVQAVLRRARTPSHTEISGSFTFNDGYLVIDISQRSVSAGGRRLKLTPREFQLLALLVGNAGHVLSHRQILEKVWGQEYVDEMDYVRIYVSHLRRKIEPDISRPKYILTEPRVGYYFCTG